MYDYIRLGNCIIFENIKDNFRDVEEFFIFLIMNYCPGTEIIANKCIGDDDWILIEGEVKNIDYSTTKNGHFLQIWIGTQALNFEKKGFKSPIKTDTSIIVRKDPLK